MSVVTKKNESWPVPEQAIHHDIVALLEGLSPETLIVVREFVAFLRERAQQGRVIALVDEQRAKPPYRYPTIPVPVSTLEKLIGIMPPVGGDALADTEALYDEA